MGQLIFNGIVFGSLYALAALGLVLIFKVSDIVNFAQGEMAMFFSFIAFTFLSFKMPYILAFILTIIISGIVGLIIERAIIKKLGNAVISAMIATFGLIMIFSGLAGSIFGTEEHQFRKIIQPGTESAVSMNYTIANQLIIIAITLIIMLVLFYFFRFTMKGLGLRAAAQDPQTARLMGVSVNRVIAFSWMTGAALASIAGMLVASQTSLSITMMQDIHLKSFCAAVLGGFNTFLGPIVGGIIVGVSENLFGSIGIGFIKWKSVFVFALIIVMLIVKPNGIMGVKYRKKV